MADGLTTQSATPATIPASSKIATDDAGSAGHVQINKLAVSNDGDATPIPATASDGLLVEISNPAAIAAGADTHTASAVASGLTTATTLYTANDTLGGLLELTNMASSSGGAGLLGSLTLVVDVISVISSVRAWFFTESVTLAANNAAFAISDADMLKCVGTAIFPVPAEATNCGIATIAPVGLDYECTATSLFVALETLSTHTNHFAAADDLHLIARAVRY